MNYSPHPMLTVVMPISQMYQKLESLKNTLEVLQKFPQIELRIIHDVQDSGTSAELTSLLTNFNKSQILFHEGYFGSAGKARNSGLMNLKAEWLMFWDSDDFPDIPQIYSYLSQNNFEGVDLIVGGYSLKNVQSNSAPKKIESNYFNLANNPGIWRCIFKVRALGNLMFTEFKVAEDQLFIIGYLVNCREVIFSPNNFYTYSINQADQTTRKIQNLACLPETALESLKLISSLPGNRKLVALIMAIRQAGTYLRKYREFGVLKRISKLLSTICRLQRD